MKNLIHEIHRRSLWQVLGIYLAATWIVLQVIDVIGANFGLPAWVAPAALVLLLLGLPVVLATAFVQEGVGGSHAASRGDDASARPRAEADVQGDAPPPADLEQAERAPATSVPRGVLTWRNALLGGGAAFALLGVGTVAFIAMRAAGVGPAGTLVAKGLMGESERVLVSDFQSPSGDVELASAATEALRIDLSQSPVISLVDRTQVGAILQRMGQPADAPLTPQLAREAAQRGGINAVVEGQIDAAGRGYVLTARLVSVATGEALVSRRETAADSSEIIRAIDELSNGLRERIGESLVSIARTPALEQVSTPSLRALRLYSQAENAVLNQGDTDRGLALLEEALEEDSTFAMAWRKLGTIRGNLGLGLSGVYEALDRAYELRSRLPDRDRYLTTAQYFSARGERERAVIAYETLLESQPNEGFALTNLGLSREMMGDREAALELYERSWASDSIALSLLHVVRGLQSTGRFGEADRKLVQLRTRFPDYANGRWLAAFIAVARGDDETASAEIDALAAEQSTSRFWQFEAALFSGGLAARRGRLEDAAERLSEARDLEIERGLPARYILGACDLALVRLLVAEDPSDALRPVEEALVRYPLSTLDPLDRPYVSLAVVYALAGRVARAKELMTAFDAEVPGDRRGSWTATDHRFARGEIALAEGRAEDAIREFEQVEGICAICALPRVAEAQQIAGDPEQAAATLEAYVTDPDALRLGTRSWPWWSYGDWVSLGSSYERLGEIYDAGGDLENAVKYYAMFVELWADADEELQPRVRAAQARLEEILREIG